MATLFPLWPPAPTFARGSLLGSRKRAAWARRQLVEAYLVGNPLEGTRRAAEALATFQPRPTLEEARTLLRACYITPDPVLALYILPVLNSDP